jgi:hypothetical protein
MKWANLYFFGFVVLLGGVVAALWKIGVLERVGAGWTAIGIVMALGIGIMVSASSSGRKESIQIEK